MGSEGPEEFEPQPEPEPSPAEQPKQAMKAKPPPQEDDLFGPDAPEQPSEAMTIGAEDEEGNVEYKLQLINPSPERFVHLVTQCQFRVSEGAAPPPQLRLFLPSRVNNS